MVQFKDRLRDALKHAGLNAVQLASRLGVTRQAVERAERGWSASFSADNCAKAARILGVDAYWFATGEGEMIAELQPSGAWPFAPRLLDQVSQLDERQRTKLEGAIEMWIQQNSPPSDNASPLDHAA